METFVYLDHNATTEVYPAVKKAILHALDVTGNASSVHGAGRAARKLIEDSRESVAALVAAKPENVIFNSGGTESNNMAIRFFGNRIRKNRILASAVEHDSVLKVSPNIELIPVDNDGIVNLKALDEMLALSSSSKGGNNTLVSVMLANNETGVIQPIKEVVSVARHHGALVHCDAVQAAGKVPIDINSLGVDFLSLSAHKIGGPAGVGALVIKEGLAKIIKLSPILYGGGQERGHRAGSENISGIMGFGLAAKHALENLPKIKNLATLRDQVEEKLSIHKDVRIFGAGVSRLANTCNLTMPGVAADRQLIAFDLAGISLSAGSACSSGKVKPSHVLAAMGIVDEVSSTAIRISLGWTTKNQDIDRFIKVWNEIFKRSKSSLKKLEAA